MSDDLLKELHEEIKKEQESDIIPVKSQTIDMDCRTGFRLKRRLVSETNCQKGLQNVRFIPLSQVHPYIAEFHTIRMGIKPSKDWATTGVVDQYFPQDSFCVVRITDLRGEHVHVYITGKAYKQYERAIGMGSILVLKRPESLCPPDTGKAAALHVDQVQQMWVLGQSLDLKQCQGYTKKEQRCQEWIDIRQGEYCNEHLMKICSYSKNGRMELASGDTGFDIRWTTVIKKSDGSISYQAMKKPEQMQSSTQNAKKALAYYVKGIGLVTVTGEQFKKKPKKESDGMDKTAIEQILKGRYDPGAQMIRKLKGIKEEEPEHLLSKEALVKMGIGNGAPLTKDEEEKKKRTFDELKNATKRQETKKKPRYIEL
ncbi:minichromosome maintenance- protein [Rhizopus azygosporus]|uniref:Minichromosome maintenance-protein n=1 Tax=Rhizopus azygosporus TaxID=86630 RepID=A0A367KFG0_RHIAZ|nr:minichromosome maintenance- protein [Rhizopus azygosporus]